MSYAIERLAVSDYEEMLDFLDFVFSREGEPHDFRNLLPTIYRPTPERMSSHLVVRRQGRIQSLVGVYPIQMHVGPVRLAGATVGAVSTHPDCRGQGMMRALMNHAVDWMQAERIQFSVLGGNRQRYRYFGYERCGLSLQYRVTAGNLKHIFEKDPAVYLRQLQESDREILALLKQQHDRQSLYCERPSDLFFFYGLNWHRQMRAIITHDHQCVGYAITDGTNKSFVPEIVAVSDDLAVDALRVLAAESPRHGVTVGVNPTQASLCRMLGDCCETVSSMDSGNWRVFDWQSVTRAFLQLWAMAIDTEDGEVMIGIRDVGTLRMAVNGRRAACDIIDEPAPATYPPMLAQRLLFGPLAPDLVVPLPNSLRVLKDWCPLPLRISDQDGA